MGMLRNKKAQQLIFNGTQSVIPLPTQRVPVFCHDVPIFISSAAGPEEELNFSAFFTGF